MCRCMINSERGVSRNTLDKPRLEKRGVTVVDDMGNAGQGSRVEAIVKLSKLVVSRISGKDARKQRSKCGASVLEMGRRLGGKAPRLQLTLLRLIPGPERTTEYRHSAI